MDKGRPGTLERAADLIGQALLPLTEELAQDELPDLLPQLGLSAALDLSGNTAFGQKLTDAGDAIGTLPKNLGDLAASIEAEDLEEILKKAADLITTVKKIADAFTAVAKELENATKGRSDADVIKAFAEAFSSRLFETAIVRYLERESPAAVKALRLLTLIEVQPVVYTVTGRERTGLTRRIYFERFAQLVQDPVGLLTTGYGWGTGKFDQRKLFAALAELLISLNVLGSIKDSPAPDFPDLDDDVEGDPPPPGPPGPLPPTLDLWVVQIAKKEVPAPGKPGLALRVITPTSSSIDIPLVDLSETWRVVLGLQGALPKDLEIALLPPATLQAKPPTGTFSGELWLRLVGAPKAPETAVQLFGLTGGSRVEATKVQVGIGGGMAIKGGESSGSFAFDAQISGGKVILDTSQSDGFLKKILPEKGLTFEFDLGIGWSTDRGFHLSGSAGLETTFSLNKTIGPFRLDTANLGVGVSGEKLRLGAGLSGGASLGPVAVSVDRLGFALALEFHSGNLGPVQLGGSFQPPSGLGIVIDAGPVTGGGFISFDFENGRYAGVLQLKLYSIGVTAIGLLDTKLPGGKPGFSFLIIIAVEFTPIQIGFGFTLNGVGGLAGINRTLVTKALQDGVRSGSLDNLLFPKDPVRRATQLISDLGKVFPPAEDRYVFGPMLKLGWGIFVEAKLGVVLEVPSPVRIALLGQLEAWFPEKKAAIVELHLDVLGLLDFGAKFFSLDASLHDSRVLVFSISGDMALRLYWGDQPSFALALGGFNPRFQPPPSFPVLRRLTIALGYGDNPRLALEAYFALTSNSFQFGAALSLYAALGPLSVRGFIGFDALFIFSPFSFIIDFAAGLEVNLGSLRLAAVHVRGTLSGPTPWHVIGEASISILFFEISVHVEFTIGDEQTNELPSVDTWAPLKKAIETRESWSAVRPPAAFEVVKLAPPEGSAAPLLIDPVGGATLRQKVLPFNQRFTKFQEARPGGADFYGLDEVGVGDEKVRPPLVQEHFAPGQLRDMTDAEKISGPQFVEMPAGFTIAGNAVKRGTGVAAEIQYQTTVLGAPDEEPARSTTPATMSGDTLLLHAQVAQAGLGLRAAGLQKYAPAPGTPPQVELDEELFVIAHTRDLKRAGIAEPASKGLSQKALAEHLERFPAEKGTLQVIPLREAA